MTQQNELEELIEVLHEWSFAKELDEAELARLHDVLVEDGRADEGNPSSMHPFDLLYAYYADSDKRKKEDSCITMFESFKKLQGVQLLLEALDGMLSKPLFRSKNLSQKADGNFEIVAQFADGEKTAVPIRQLHAFADTVRLYNIALSDRDDPLRFVRLCSYDDREALLLVDMEDAEHMELTPMKVIFQDLDADLSPEPMAEINS